MAPFQDGSGYIDENELDALLKDLYEKNKKVRGLAQRWGAVTEVVWKWEGWPRSVSCSPLITPNKATAVFWVLFMVDFFFNTRTKVCHLNHF